VEHPSPQKPQLSVVVRSVLQPLPSQLPQLAAHPLQVPPVHAVWASPRLVQSESVQHCWQVPLQDTAPLGQPQPASLSLTPGLHSNPHVPASVQVEVAFAGAAHAAPHDCEQPTFGELRALGVHVAPQRWLFAPQVPLSSPPASVVVSASASMEPSGGLVVAISAPVSIARLVSAANVPSW